MYGFFKWPPLSAHTMIAGSLGGPHCRSICRYGFSSDASTARCFNPPYNLERCPSRKAPSGMLAPGAWPLMHLLEHKLLEDGQIAASISRTENHGRYR